MKKQLKPHLWLVSLISRIVPVRFRSDWKNEWEAELTHRESILSRRGQPAEKAWRDLIRRSLASFWDALAMQPRRLEDEIMQDLRYGFRLLLQHKGVATIAILSLALGIGANTALFSLVDAMLLKKLPVQNPDELVLFNWSAPEDTNNIPMGITFDGNRKDPVTGLTVWDSFSYRVFEQFKANNQTLSEIFAFARIYRANIVAGNDAQMGNGQLVSGGYFRGLGVNTVAGRPIQASDDDPAAPPVAVIGYRYWSQRFGEDPSIVGKTLKVNSVAVSVIGVAPPDFSGTLQVQDSPDIYIPMAMEPLVVSPNGGSPLNKTDQWWLQIMGRLEPGVSPAQVRGNMTGTFQQSVQEMLRESPPNPPVVFNPILDAAPGGQGLQSKRTEYEQSLMILMVMMALALLVACANVANLLLARAASREKEIATRLSVGATRLRLIRQLLTESILLASLAGFVGVVLAYWGKDILLRWGPWSSPAERVSAKIDLRVLAFAIAISVATGILFGLAPAVRAIRSGIASTLVRNARTLSTARSRIAKTLLVTQIAMSLVLLTAAGFFVQTLWKLSRVDTGFNTTNLLLFKIDPALNRYSPARFNDTVEQIIQRLERIEGVRAATVADHALVGDGGNFGSLNHSRISAAMMGVRSNFFYTMGVPVLAGRSFTDRDTANAPKVAIINETLARRYFADTNPIGKDVWGLEVVGVVRDTKIMSLRRQIPPAVFTPYTQGRPQRLTFEIRSSVDPTTLIPAVREAVRQVDSDLPIFDIRTQDEQIARTQMTQERLFANFAGAFGGTALFLVCVGLYGVVSYSVARRTHEIGIRMALGAQRSDVRMMVLRETLLLIGAGIVLGLITVLSLMPRIQSMLFGLPPNDPVTLAIAIGLMAGLAAFAGYLPARRASRVDPLTALRYE